MGVERLGCVVYLTGLPSAGKTTLARAVQASLARRGVRAVLLDGDEVRAALCPPPGYDEAGRAAFYATLARIASLLSRQGHVVLVAATAHRRAFRDEARSLAPSFVEVWVATPPDECRRRDAKGLYATAAGGGDAVRAIDLPGAGAMYEPPLAPDVVAEGGEDERATVAIRRRVLEGLRGREPLEGA